MAELNRLYYYSYESHDESGDYSGNDEGYDSPENKDPDEKPEIEQHNTEAGRGSVVNTILLSVMAALILGTVVYTLNRRNTMYNKVAAKNRELSVVESENVRLQAELENRISAKNVEYYAEKELGMRKIDPSQIKYIKIQTGDVVNIPEQEESLGDKIKGFFDKCVEYFRG